MADKIEGTDLVETKVEDVKPEVTADKPADNDEPVRTQTATKGQIRDAYFNGKPRSFGQLAEDFDVTVEQVRQIIEEYQATLTPED